MSGAILDDIDWVSWVPYRFEGAPCTLRQLAIDENKKEVQQ